MRQQRLNFRSSKALEAWRIAYEGGNARAAEMILADVASYGGESSAMVRWARKVEERRRAESTNEKRTC
jgi:hypothetical protein